MKAEMAVFQSICKQGRCLEAVYRYLLSVLPATSVEAEHAFSAAGLLCTKVRSCLDNSSIVSYVPATTRLVSETVTVDCHMTTE